MLFHLFPASGSAYQRAERQRQTARRAEKAAHRKRVRNVGLEKTLMGRKRPR